MIEKMNYLEIVRAKLPDQELLAQLAEEAAELGQAALKMRRAIDGTNPTPTTLQQAHDNLLEEICDVENCVNALIYNTPAAVKVRADLRAEKLERWAERLVKRDGDHATCKICGKPVTAGPVYHAECLEKSSGWISVKEKMPDRDQDILAFSPELKETMIGSLEETKKHGVVCFGYGIEAFFVTHWMPLPEPPGKEG